MSACRSCGAPVVWVRNLKTGKTMPIDAVSATIRGNLVMCASEPPTVRVADMLDGPEVPRFTSHFATCPDAPGWRKPRTK